MERKDTLPSGNESDDSDAIFVSVKKKNRSRISSDSESEDVHLSIKSDLDNKGSRSIVTSESDFDDDLPIKNDLDRKNKEIKASDEESKTEHRIDSKNRKTKANWENNWESDKIDLSINFEDNRKGSRSIVSSDSDFDEDLPIKNGLDSKDVEDRSTDEEDKNEHLIDGKVRKVKAKRENKHEAFDCTRETSRLQRESVISLPRYSMPKHSLEEFLKQQRCGNQPIAYTSPSREDISNTEKFSKQNLNPVKGTKTDTLFEDAESCDDVAIYDSIKIMPLLTKDKRESKSQDVEFLLPLEQSNDRNEFIVFDNENDFTNPLEQFRKKLFSHKIKIGHQAIIAKALKNDSDLSISKFSGTKLQTVQSQLMVAMKKKKETAFEKQLQVQQLDEEDLPADFSDEDELNYDEPEADGDHELSEGADSDQELSEDADIAHELSKDANNMTNHLSERRDFVNLPEGRDDVHLPESIDDDKVHKVSKKSESQKIDDKEDPMIEGKCSSISYDKTFMEIEKSTDFKTNSQLYDSQVITSYQPGGGFPSQSSGYNSSEISGSQIPDPLVDNMRCAYDDSSEKYSKFTSHLMKITLGRYSDSSSRKEISSPEVEDNLVGNEMCVFKDNTSPALSLSATPSSSDVLPFCSGNFSDSLIATPHETSSAENMSQAENQDIWVKRSLILEDSSQDSTHSASDVLPFCSGNFSGSSFPITANNQQEKSNESSGKDIVTVFEEHPSDLLAQSDDFPFCAREFLNSKSDSLPFLTNKSCSTSGVITRNMPQSQENKKCAFSDDDSSLQENIIVRKKTAHAIKLDDSDSEDDGCSDDSSESYKIESDEDNQEILEKEKLANLDNVHQYFDKEAELSGEDEVSDDEEEEEDDDTIIEDEPDSTIPSSEKIRSQIGPLHAKQIMDDDIYALKMLKDQLFEDGELYTDGPGRNRKFTWLNKDEAFLNDSNNEDDMSESENDVIKNEDQWAILREEKVKWRHEQKNEEDILELIESPLESKKHNFKLNILGKKEETKKIFIDVLNVSTVHESGSSTKRKRGSILSREEVFASTLKKLKGSDCDPNGSRTTKHFVFRNGDDEDQLPSPNTKPVSKPTLLSQPNSLLKTFIPTLTNVCKTSVFEHL